MAEVGSKLIYAIDQGTSSTRVIVFNLKWEVVTQHQVEFQSIYPEEGWCEVDPKVLLDTVKQVRTLIIFCVKIQILIGINASYTVIT